MKTFFLVKTFSFFFLEIRGNRPPLGRYSGKFENIPTNLKMKTFFLVKTFFFFFLDITLILWEKRGKFWWKSLFIFIFWRTHYTFGNILFWTFGHILPDPQTLLLSYGYEKKELHKSSKEPVFIIETFVFSKCLQFKNDLIFWKDLRTFCKGRKQIAYCLKRQKCCYNLVRVTTRDLGADSGGRDPSARRFLQFFSKLTHFRHILM